MKHLLSLIISVSLMLLQSCDLYDMGRKNPHVQLPSPPDKSYTTDRDREWCYAGCESFKVNSGLEISPIAPIRYNDRGSFVIVRTPDLQMAIASYALSPSYSTEDVKAYNYLFRHYTDIPENQIVGSNIESMTERWGDYIFAQPDDRESDAKGRVYTFTYIMLLQNDSYLKGVKLYTDSNGVIIDVMPHQGTQHNLFGYLPFYDDILSLNLMQWLMPGPWLDAGREVPSRGIFVSLLNTLFIFGVCLLIVSIVGILVYIPFDRLLPKDRTELRFIPMIAIIAAESIVYYIIVITLIDYYSAAWWITLPLMFGWACYVPFSSLMLFTRDYCPKCQGHKWTFSSRIKEVILPQIVFNIEWQGTYPKAVPPEESEIMIRSKEKKTCKSCGYNEESEHSSKVRRKRNLCPKCFNETLKGDFTSYNYDGQTLTAEYLERCTSPGCGYRCRHTLNKNIRRRQPSPAPVNTARNSERNRPEPPKPEGPCFFCTDRLSSKPRSGESSRCKLGDHGLCEFYYNHTLCPYYKYE